MRREATPFSDEAALLEAQGIVVASVPGEAANIKVTEPADLEIVRGLARGSRDERLGFGEDVHPFGPEMGLWLGGTLIEEAPRLYGHSDGDVVLHALATAVLNAIGQGDLGRLFPPTDSRTTGIASCDLVAAACAAATQAGFGASWARVALVGARPRLGAARIEAMRGRVAELLSIHAREVAIVASTGNLSGAAGAGRAISATALVGVYRR